MAASALTEFATHSELVQQESAGSAVCTSNFVSRLWFSQVSMRVSLLIKTSQLQASNPGPAIPYNLAQLKYITAKSLSNTRSRERGGRSSRSTTSASSAWASTDLTTSALVSGDAGTKDTRVTRLGLMFSSVASTLTTRRTRISSWSLRMMSYPSCQLECGNHQPSCRIRSA